jgi:hypothetical protein
MLLAWFSKTTHSFFFSAATAMTINDTKLRLKSHGGGTTLQGLR